MVLLRILLMLTAVLAGPLCAQEEQVVSVRDADGKRVERIRFIYEKDKALLNKELRSAMRIQEGKRFSRRFFNSDLAAVVNLYRGKGYREAEITSKRLAVDKRDRLHIAIELDSGEKWTVERVRILGGAPFDSTFLGSLVNLRSGDDLNYGEVLEGELNLQVFFNQQGYPHATVHNEWKDHPAD